MIHNIKVEPLKRQWKGRTLRPLVLLMLFLSPVTGTYAQKLKQPNAPANRQRTAKPARLASLNQPSKKDTTRRRLVVSLYPAIPNAADFYHRLETKYEEANREVDLVVNWLSVDDYYNEKAGLIAEKADVYELDCVMLQDFIDAHKIQPLPPSFPLDQAGLMPAAMVVYQNKTLYAVPHWLCGNFLFYRKSDSKVKETQTLSDLATVIGQPSTMENGLLIDVKGRLTLGELYSEALLDRHGKVEEILSYIDVNESKQDPAAFNALNRLPDLTYGDWGRNDYHSKAGFYPRQFAKQHGRAFVGYSESLYEMANEAINACANEEKCLSMDDVEVKNFNLSDNSSTPVGWIDALAIDKALTGQKLDDALAFIRLITSYDGYKLALVPAQYEAPRYLLPPYSKYYADTAFTDNAKLYIQLYPLAIQLHAFTAPKLWPNLRAIGKSLDSRLKK